MVKRKCQIVNSRKPMKRKSWMFISSPDRRFTQKLLEADTQPPTGTGFLFSKSTVMVRHRCADATVL